MKPGYPFAGRVFVMGFILVMGLLAGCRGRQSTAYDWQQTVDRMRELLTAHKNHPSWKVSEKEHAPAAPLDVNRYFGILTRIWMAPGYDLDYIYAEGGLGSEPILYARRSTEPRLQNLNALARQANRRIRWPHDYYDYLEKVQVNGTGPSFFELVVLRVMGGQFYLFWHSLYNDRRIVCDRSVLDRLWEQTFDGIPDEKIPQAVREQAGELDFTPRVEFNGDTATVHVVVFTKWGGFIRESYRMSRSFPHRILKIDRETLVHYDCGICF